MNLWAYATIILGGAFVVLAHWWFVLNTRYEYYDEMGASINFDQPFAIGTLFCLHQISITQDDLKMILELNRIRNRLAHDADFEKNHEDLRRWACLILDYTPKTIRRKKTYRNTLAKAFAVLIGFYAGLSRSRHEIIKMS